MSSSRRSNRFVLMAVATAVVFLLWHTTGHADVSRFGRSFAEMGERGFLVRGQSPFAASGTRLPFVRLLPESMPHTVWVKGLPGFNYFENLYLHNGTFYAVVTDPEAVPEVAQIMSDFPDDDGNTHQPAKADRWKVLVQGRDDLSALGQVAVVKSGISMFFNDEQGKNSVSFLKHYFHFIGEVFLGAWRVLTTAGERELPARLMYRTTPDDWRDHAGLTSWFQQSVMPNTAIEEASIWEDRAKSGMTFLFDKITITDRWAAHAKGEHPKYWNKMTADLFMLDAPMGWMEPLRQSMETLVLTEGCDVHRKDRNVPVVTYINRQLTGRRLLAADHEGLMEAMEGLHKQGVIEFVDAQMETKSRIEQFCMALRSDVIMGVHGNGLSHALWMKPGSAMIEIMYPGGFAKDYAMIGELMRHDYYAIHNDTVLTPDKWSRPDGWSIGQNQGFHGSYIPVHGPFMADLIRGIAAEKR
ncbi:hypothetical protein EHS25_003151 [Saitozyma podzolica]|uniref:Glycosyltransferase 61 catalytic domain-containing protein n=1 Tax=Saitozyma podzolica TaxID=1890683 RepID=A0A427Y818_9TREE|nr:hypothetical protein EHS25_003151 [Saitozyma podzolica]